MNLEKFPMGERISNGLLFAGSIAAMLGVAIGAFGAHGLRNIVSPEHLATFETAVRYQMYHSFGLIVAGLACRVGSSDSSRKFKVVGWLFGVGILLFSGSLYLLVLLNLPWLGAITPLGGVAFIAAWALFAMTFRKRD
jgi:uncharacterized membrane protein YgdD (TMEM256/DUF423 family)